MFEKLMGRYRLFWNACPSCNSDAPRIDNCVVCKNGRDTYPPTEITKSAWWCRFLQKLEIEKKCLK